MPCHTQAAADALLKSLEVEWEDGSYAPLTPAFRATMAPPARVQTKVPHTSRRRITLRSWYWGVISGGVSQLEVWMCKTYVKNVYSAFLADNQRFDSSHHDSGWSREYELRVRGRRRALAGAHTKTRARSVQCRPE